MFFIEKIHEEERLKRISKAYQRQKEEYLKEQSQKPKTFYDEVFSKKPEDIIEEDAAAASSTKKKGRREEREGMAAKREGNTGSTGNPLVCGKAKSQWKIEEKRRIDMENERLAREKALKKSQRRRKEERDFLTKKTRKGQPVMGNIVQHLLEKMEKGKN